MLRKSRIARFAVTGVANAAISFGLLNWLYYGLGQSKIASSIVATAIALLFSFAMNRIFVFGDTTKAIHRQFVPFVVVTVLGSFVILNVVYVGSLRLLEGNEHYFISPVYAATGIRLSESFIDINLSTVIGAIAAMFWNYNGYRLFVFKGRRPEDRHDEVEQTQGV